MADQDLPEPSPAGSGRGKQIVFLFMSAVVIAVVIFLLGVSVGRGVRKGNDPASSGDGVSTPATDTTVATNPPAQTPPTDLKYHDTLRSGAPPDPSRADKPGATPPASATTSGPPPAVDEAPPMKEPAKDKTFPAPSSSSASMHRGGSQYFLQVGAYGSMAAAQKVMAKVKAADAAYSVSTVTMPDNTPPPRFRVMVGPYPSVDEAKAVMARLKKQGFETILKR